MNYNLLRLALACLVVGFVFGFASATYIWIRSDSKRKYE